MAERTNYRNGYRVYFYALRLVRTATKVPSDITPAKPMSGATRPQAMGCEAVDILRYPSVGAYNVTTTRNPIISQSREKSVFQVL